MRILHVGWGFQPWCSGGMPEYVEDLMETQRQQGHEVYYFCSGRHYPLIKKPRLKKRRFKSICGYEIINSPIIYAFDSGTANPLLELDEPYSEIFFRQVLKDTRPEVVHIQSLLGLPSSIIEIAKTEFRLPLVMTLLDYFPLCPTIQLFDYTQERCIDRMVGEKCAICCKNAAGKNPLLVHTLIYELRHFGSYQFLKWMGSLVAKYRRAVPAQGARKIPNDRLQEAFQKRRDVNVERLRKIDVLIAPSRKAGEIYSYFLHQPPQVAILSCTPRHVKEIVPKKMEKVIFPIRFATLNGCSSIAKGALLVYEAIRNLKRRGLGSYFEIHIFGGIPQPLLDECLKWNRIFHHGSYRIQDLNRLLDRIDVGVMPSIWEEPYGYTGVEFLAKGIPLIGNNRGGIPEYVLPHFTGWLNQTATANELTELMHRIIESPEEILELNQKILDHRDQLIKSMDEHSIELEALYHKLR